MQRNLRVDFTPPKIERLGADRAKAAFVMTQTFTGPDGATQSGRLGCEYTFALTDGRLKEITGSQGSCKPLE